ncbi:hypothetical protein [Gloeocapsa sp. PCC 73106]|uniref:hypothetical protein n=1 Tax=Gloeocapsa sp. PCC 73106 TaxID=102232 RepID=UPI0002AC55A2|nr:hypothetical protein [Gloeocapsa sp. PCC 73106]ELS00001.1 hypothetical protein GLO73106DRAFT_00038540 [Gloeocapsa sp. PCC 73106]
MAGFFGLFGGKTKYIDGNDNQANDKDNQEAFFLNSDDAKTLGNMELMRKSPKTKKTFSQPGKTTNSVESTASSENQPKTTPNRSSVDPSMDLFRKMAREIKK